MCYEMVVFDYICFSCYLALLGLNVIPRTSSQTLFHWTLCLLVCTLGFLGQKSNC